MSRRQQAVPKPQVRRASTANNNNTNNNNNAISQLTSETKASIGDDSDAILTVQNPQQHQQQNTQQVGITGPTKRSLVQARNNTLNNDTTISTTSTTITTTKQPTNSTINDNDDIPSNPTSIGDDRKMVLSIASSSSSISSSATPKSTKSRLNQMTDIESKLQSLTFLHSPSLNPNDVTKKLSKNKSNLSEDVLSTVSTSFKTALARVHYMAKASLSNNNNNNPSTNPKSFKIVFPTPGNEGEAMFLQWYKEMNGYSQSSEGDHKSTTTTTKRLPNSISIPRFRLLIPQTTSKSSLKTQIQPKLMIKMDANGQEVLGPNGQNIITTKVNGQEVTLLTHNNRPITINGMFIIIQNAKNVQPNKKLNNKNDTLWKKISQKLSLQLISQSSTSNKASQDEDLFDTNNGHDIDTNNNNNTPIQYTPTTKLGAPHAYLVRDPNGQGPYILCRTKPEGCTTNTKPLFLITIARPREEKSEEDKSMADSDSDDNDDNDDDDDDDSNNIKKNRKLYSQPLFLYKNDQGINQFLRPYICDDAKRGSKRQFLLPVDSNGKPLENNLSKKKSLKKSVKKLFPMSFHRHEPIGLKERPTQGQYNRNFIPSTTSLSSHPLSQFNQHPFLLEQHHLLQQDFNSSSSSSSPQLTQNSNNNTQYSTLVTTATTTSSNPTARFNTQASFGALMEADNALIQHLIPTNHSTALTTTTGEAKHGHDLINSTTFISDFSDLTLDPFTTIEQNAVSQSVVQIQNMVGVVYLGCPIDLKEIAMRAKNAEYNPRRFISVILRLRDPRTTALLFRSGKLLITGARTEHQTRLAARKCARLVQKLGHPNVTFNNFTISNMVGAADVRFPVNLTLLAKQHGQYCEFEPEVFPAVVYRLQSPSVVALIFVNGKIVLTAGKKREDLYTAFEHLYQLLLDFRKSTLEQLANNAVNNAHNVANSLNGTMLNNQSMMATTTTTTTTRSTGFNPFSSSLNGLANNFTTLGERSMGSETHAGSLADDHD